MANSNSNNSSNNNSSKSSSNTNASSINNNYDNSNSINKQRHARKTKYIMEKQIVKLYELVAAGHTDRELMQMLNIPERLL